jgi:hypothetical protein
MLPILKNGELVAPLPTLADARARCAEQVASLQDRLRRLERVEPYPVSFSQHLEDELNRLATEQPGGQP